ncbi:hypothetical protein ACFQT0_06305 [Hymenobacter humi]|uniref:Uncharacterized protein n=1 Tax=Hymenobacter humi TaxID=1411620 RepID=A0ABW2U223_9BACT
MVCVLLLAALGGCTIFHPYRLPTPKPSPEFKAQQKAAKARKKNNEPSALFRKRADPNGEEAATDVSTPTGGTVRKPDATAEARTLPDHATVSYDKNGLLKKPKLMRRRINKPARKPFRPWRSIRNFFKNKRHGKPNYSPDHRPAAPASAAEPDTAPGVAPAVAPATKPAAAPATAPTTAPAKVPTATPVPTSAPAVKSKP